MLCAVWQARRVCLDGDGYNSDNRPRRTSDALSKVSLELLACLPRQAWEWLLIQPRRLDMAARRSREVDSLEATEYEFQTAGGKWASANNTMLTSPAFLLALTPVVKHRFIQKGHTKIAPRGDIASSIVTAAHHFAHRFEPNNDTLTSPLHPILPIP